MPYIMGFVSGCLTVFMPTKNKLQNWRGLYAITPDAVPTVKLATQVEQALQGGAQVVQYRNKQLDALQRCEQALTLRALCQAYKVPLLINDDVELALAIGADGVHLGLGDLDPAIARQRLGTDAIIGVSCYDQFALAYDAYIAGADYVAFGSFFPSPTKPLAIQASTRLLRHAKNMLPIPTVAIGGITLENGSALVVAGADMLAVIGGLFEGDDVRVTAKLFTALFSKTTVHH